MSEEIRKIVNQYTLDELPFKVQLEIIRIQIRKLAIYGRFLKSQLDNKDCDIWGYYFAEYNSVINMLKNYGFYIRHFKEQPKERLALLNIEDLILGDVY